MTTLVMIAMAWTFGSGCSDPEVQFSDREEGAPQTPETPDPATDPDFSTDEFPEAIEPGPMGTVFDFEGEEIPRQAYPGELRTDEPFLQFDVFFTGEGPVLEYQLEDHDGQWSDWQTFVPDATYAGSFAGVITLDQPASALRYRTEGAMDYLYFEFFKEAVDLGDHDHEEHAHEDDTGLEDDPEYGPLADDEVTEEEEEGTDLEDRASDLSIRHQELITSCEKRRMAAYSRGTRLADIEVIRMDGKNVGVNTGSAYEKMRVAAARNGVSLRVVSGFRTMAEQEYLYGCYRTKRCNNGNLAARPGYSNHQNGLALDLNTRDSGVLRWLNANGSRYGFRRTVRSEPWHWEYTAGRVVTPQICSDEEAPTEGGGNSTTTCSATNACVSSMDCVENQCVTTGKLRFTLIWEGNIDLDIHVETPSGAKLWYQERETRDGGIFDSDSCIGTTCASSGVSRESVYWTSEPTHGHYTFWAVNYTGDRQAALTFDVNVNGERKTFESTVPASRNGESYKFTISYPDGEVIGQ